MFSIYSLYCQFKQPLTFFYYYYYYWLAILAQSDIWIRTRHSHQMDVFMFDMAMKLSFILKSIKIIIITKKNDFFIFDCSIKNINFFSSFYFSFLIFFFIYIFPQIFFQPNIALIYKLRKYWFLLKFYFSLGFVLANHVIYS